MIDRSKYGLPKGSDIFKMASYENKILAKNLAEKENRYTTDILLDILKVYEIEIGRIQIQHVNNVIRGMANDGKKLEKRKMGVYNRYCLTMSDVIYLLKHFKNKGLIRDYREEDIQKDIELIISEMDTTSSNF